MLLGEHLTSLFSVKQEDIERALTVQKKVGGYLGQILIQQGIITETQLVSALSEQLHIPLFNNDSYSGGPGDIITALDRELDLNFMLQNNFVPVDFDREKGVITFVTNDPLNNSVEEYVVRNTAYSLTVLLAAEQTIKELARVFAGDKEENFVSLHIEDTPERLKEMAFEAPVIKFLNTLLSRAVELRATDIHIEPVGNSYRVRFRVDGILHEIETLEEAFYLATVSRIKLLSTLDIAEKRLPQDGKFSTKIASVFLDIRVSTIPMVKGESVVLRLLYRERLTFDIMKLGMESDHAKTIIDLIARPYGILLVTGPTGSGKTTSLYSMLTRLNNTDRKIITVEDPVEYQIEGINQIQVKSDIGLTFASALRSILRHDPDVIMVGEIRDRETAEISIHSALTGHLVLSTLHTNDSPSSLFRMMEMGLEDYLLNAAVIGVIAQRIIRKNCSRCSEAHSVSDDVIKEFHLREIRDAHRHLLDGGMDFKKGKGCPACAGTGYKGRMSIFECFDYTDDLKEIFLKNHSLEAMRAALREGYAFRTLREDGMLKVMRGVTTIEEILRVS
jgi:type II secretory ATPase GspE/PulE/Tfp pilus assembly ATPase PilB-like protein